MDSPSEDSDYNDDDTGNENVPSEDCDCNGDGQGDNNASCV